MDLVILKRDSPVWEWLWNDYLATHPINEGYLEPIVCLNKGCTWEYMGTLISNDKAISTLRHLCHPKTNDIVSISVEHSESLTIGDIDVSKPVK